MDRTAKLYKLLAELAMLKNDIEAFEAIHPNPTERTGKEAANYDFLLAPRNRWSADRDQLGNDGLQPETNVECTRRQSAPKCSSCLSRASLETVTSQREHSWLETFPLPR